jgi:CubicO group peptidase (beta-lactamase class C family)
MAPGQNTDDIDSLPENRLTPPPGNPEEMPWPNGDRIDPAPLPAGIDAVELQAASDWAFDRDSLEQVTLSLIVVRGDSIIHERYAEGVNAETRTRTWSTAKSIAVTLIGMLVDQGKLSLDGPLDIDWLPAVDHSGSDPRSAITLRHLLNMSSGLYPVDSFGMEYADGSGLAYWAGASSAAEARKRGLIREPGVFWDYENYDTLLAVYAMKRALGDERTYRDFPRTALLDRIGMRSTLVSTDRFGDFILSSQVYTNARDLARFGLLYLRNGVWDGERLLSEDSLRSHAGPLDDRAGRLLRRPVVAGSGRSHRCAARRLCDGRQPGPVRHRGALPRPGHRPARAGLGQPGFRPLGTASRGHPRGAAGGGVGPGGGVHRAASSCLHRTTDPARVVCRVTRSQTARSQFHPTKGVA